MKQKKYEMEKFDTKDGSMVKNLVHFFYKQFEIVKIKLFYETTGFYEYVSLFEFNKRLNHYSRGYTGLDEIIIEKDGLPVMTIVIHEKLCMFNIEGPTKEKIEKEFCTKLIQK